MTNSPRMMIQLWPKIQSAIITASSPTSSPSPTQTQWQNEGTCLPWPNGCPNIRLSPANHWTSGGCDVLRITSTAIRGSDLHLYHGSVSGMQPGQTLGAWIYGWVVEKSGPQVTEAKAGDKGGCTRSASHVAAPADAGTITGPNSTRPTQWMLWGQPFGYTHLTGRW